MRATAATTAVLIGLAAFSTGARGESLVDQELLINQGFFARFGANAGIAQSFKQVHDNITGASVQTHINGSGIGDVTIELYDALPTMGGSVLASGTVGNVAAGDLARVEFGFVSIIPETTYFLVFSGSNSDMGVASTDGLGTGIDLYLRGQGYHTNFTPIARTDINFQTFYEDGAQAIPEPSSLISAGLGLVSLAGYAGWRRGRPAKP